MENEMERAEKIANKILMGSWNLLNLFKALKKAKDLN